MLTLNDGRKEMYQWDIGRIATVDVVCDVVHFSNLKYGGSLSVEVKNGEVAIPNKLLTSGEPIYCWAFVADENGNYTKQEQTLNVNKRAKPSDYVYTETETLTWKSLDERITELEKGGTGGTGVNGKDGATFIPTVSPEGIISWENDKGLQNPEPVNIKGDPGVQGEQGVPGKDGINGHDGVDGKDGENGMDGKDGTSITVSNVTESTENGGTNIVTFSDGSILHVKNGEKGADGANGSDGKTAYQYAQDGGYTGTEAEFAKKLAQERFANPNSLTFTGAVTGSYDGSSPLTVNIPSGGGGLSDYELIDTLDWSTEELAQFGAGKEYSFEEIQDICLVYTGVANDTTTVSGLNVVVNNIKLGASAEPASGKSGIPMNGYVFLHSIPGIGLFSLKSPGATESTNYGGTNANISYNLHPVTGKITQFKIYNRAMSYCTNMGILKIYVR